MTLKTGLLGLIFAGGLAAQTAAGSFAVSGSNAAGFLGPAVGSWSIIQHHLFSTTGSTGSGSCASGTSTCTVNVSAIGAGHLLVCLPHGVSVSGVNACSGDGDTWTECCLITQGTQTADLWWVLSSTGGGTSVTCNFSSTSTYKECDLREYSLSAGSPVQDSSNTGICGIVGGSCAGLALSITGSSDLIVQSIFPTGSTSAISGTYGNLDVSTSGGGFADQLNTVDGSAPSWAVTGSGFTVVNALSFKTSFGLLAPRPPTATRPGPRARAPARRAARRRRRRRQEREEKRDDRDERRDDRK